MKLSEEDALYFSIVTFTTLGYGDFVPSASARLLAASQAVIGMTLIGAFISISVGSSKS